MNEEILKTFKELDLEISTQAEFEVDKILPLLINRMSTYGLPDTLKILVIELVKESFIVGARYGLAKGIENVFSKGKEHD